jgi:DNA-binding beta-propeller fold protein YncE
MKTRFAATLLWIAGCASPVDIPPASLPPIAASAAPSAVAHMAPDRHASIVGGGTVTVLADGHTVAAADPDRDVIDLVYTDDLNRGDVHVLRSVQLPENSQPMRLALDAKGTLYAVLRGTGELAAIDPQSATLTFRARVCAEPRGLAFDTHAGLMRVACAEGVMASVDPRDGSVATERWAADLRDPLPMPDGTLAATTFKAPLLITAAKGTAPLLPSIGVATVQGTTIPFEPNTASRSMIASDGSIITVHQRAVQGPVEALATVPVLVTVGQPACVHAWAGTTMGRCNDDDLFGQNIMVPVQVEEHALACPSPVVRSVVTRRSPDGEIASIEIPGVAPVDVAISPDGAEAAVALAGSGTVFTVPLSSVQGIQGTQCMSTLPMIETGGIPSGVAYKADGSLVIHTLSPNRVMVRQAVGGNPYGITLEATPTPARSFFYNSPAGTACASCHPEARDDGHTWETQQERRRTLSLSGGLLATAPFHWDGNLNTMSNVVQFTFVGRMGGTMPSADVVEALGHWLDQLPGPAPVGAASAELVNKGRDLFQRSSCGTCHSGPALTNNLTLDVGTGAAVQVPSLRGVGSHGPWLHDGRAATLRDRFKPIGGGDLHGSTSWMDDTQLDALVAYLETL